MSESEIRAVRTNQMKLIRERDKLLPKQTHEKLHEDKGRESATKQTAAEGQTKAKITFA